MPDRSQRLRWALSLGVAVALLFAAGSFFAGWRQSVLTARELAGHVHANCVQDARRAAARRALDEALLAGDIARLRADLAAGALRGTPQSRALLAADIAFLRTAIPARRADLAAAPPGSLSQCHAIPLR